MCVHDGARIGHVAMREYIGRNREKESEKKAKMDMNRRIAITKRQQRN